MKTFDPSVESKPGGVRRRSSGCSPAGEPVSDVILDSWKRCTEAGLKQSDRITFLPLTDRELKEARDRSKKLLHYAGPGVENMYEQVAGSSCLVVVADPTGLIVYSHGDPNFIDDARRVALQPGVSWAEMCVGTNALGTSLFEQDAVRIHGDEHFLARNRFLSGAASLIFDPGGEVAGVVGIYGNCNTTQLHTFGFVRMSSVLIENRMLTREFANEIAVYFHPDPEYIGTVKHGISIFSQDGRLLGANRQARRFWQPLVSQSGDLTFDALFDDSFARLIDQARTSGHVPFHVRLHNRTSVLVSVVLGPAAARVPSRTEAATPEPLRLREKGAPASGSKANLPILNDLDTGDPAMRSAIEKASMILGCDIPLFIEGESGVGKELFAQAFHNSGPRRSKPFVAVNCASIPEGLIESELFGYEEGAFTGAKRRGYVGKIQQAHEGTLFLDEIGDMPLSLQGRLLRVLQERCVTPLGSIKTIPVDTSVVCATHRKIHDEIAKGRFREDLYYRLNGLRVTLPPLRQRKDLEELVYLIIRGKTGNRDVAIDPTVMEAFRQFSWPGNIRQLQMVLRTALAILGEGDMITFRHLADEFLEEASRLGAKLGATSAEQPGSDTMEYGELERIELMAIKKALEENRGNISATARQLGISRKTLYRKMERL